MRPCGTTVDGPSEQVLGTCGLFAGPSQSAQADFAPHQP
jgi:hypothetical protein